MPYETVNGLFTGIADAIRSVDGTVDPIAHQDMPTKISGITVGDLFDVGYVVKAVNGANHIIEVDYYNSSGHVYSWSFTNYSYYGTFRYTTTVNLKNGISVVDSGAFRYAYSLTTITGLEFVTSIEPDRAFESCTSLATISLPRVTNLGGADLCFNSCSALQNVQLGSIGYPVSALNARTFYVCTQVDLTITIYVVPGTQPFASSPWGATNATIVYRSAVDGSVL